MSSRPVVSYGDITLPYDAPAPTPDQTQHQPKSQPPSKKRKRNNHKKASTHVPPQQQQHQHWDDPTPAPALASTTPAAETNEDDETMIDDTTETTPTTTSRELTHVEIWDDSALIDAWDAAMEEYEAYHGPDAKDAWKKEPVHKSPLYVVNFSHSPHNNSYDSKHRWYNIPPKNLSKKAASSSAPQTNGSASNDSKPIDFNTFVPTHDPSLYSAVPQDAEDTSQHFYTTSLASQPHVSQDEAFERAVQASYWSGYWTAVYHARLQCHFS
jgi:hypothetical protein